jgi:hypothetical protein
MPVRLTPAWTLHALVPTWMVGERESGCGSWKPGKKCIDARYLGLF